MYQRLESRATGLSTEEAEARLSEHGPNVVAADGRKSLGLLLWHAVINPLVLLLAVLATISFSTGDARAGIVMSLMIALGVGIRLIQERRADSTAAKLKAMISVTATALRDGGAQELWALTWSDATIPRINRRHALPGALPARACRLRRRSMGDA